MIFPFYNRALYGQKMCVHLRNQDIYSIYNPKSVLSKLFTDGDLSAKLFMDFTVYSVSLCSENSTKQKTQ